MPLDIVAHDIDPRRMADLPARAARAGQRIETVSTADLARRAPFDLVLIDAPCSGSGTWRRNPEAKWRLTPERLAELSGIQVSLLIQAAVLVRESGIVAYATCSLFEAENFGPVARFRAARGGWALRHERRWRPGPDGDGFYLAVLSQP